MCNSCATKALKVGLMIAKFRELLRRFWDTDNVADNATGRSTTQFLP